MSESEPSPVVAPPTFSRAIALGGKVCSMPDCSKTSRYGQRYCPACHCKYMRVWRAKRKRDEQKLRETVVHLRKKVVELKKEVDSISD